MVYGKHCHHVRCAGVSPEPTGFGGLRQDQHHGEGVRLSYGHSSTQVPTNSRQIIPTHLFIVQKGPPYWNPHPPRPAGRYQLIVWGWGYMKKRKKEKENVKKLGEGQWKVM